MHSFDLDRLASLPIEAVAARLGIEVQRHRALCFMHDDHHPSLTFSTSKNIWWCFVCGDGGGPIKLVQAYLGIPFAQACRWLEEEFQISGSRFHDSDSTIQVSRCVSTLNSQLSTPAATGCGSDTEVYSWLFGHAVLSDKARQFLFDQRHYSPEQVELLGIKSVSNSANLLKNLAYLFGEERTVASGLACRGPKGKLYSYLHDPCLLYPYRDADGAIVSLQARYLGSDPRCPRFQFLKGHRMGLFNLPVLKDLADDEPLYLAEGVSDCLAHLTLRHKAVAIPSATLLHPEALQPLAGRHLILYPDADEAGQRLCDRLQQLLPSLDATLDIRPLPRGCKDFSDFLVTGEQ